MCGSAPSDGIEDLRSCFTVRDRANKNGVVLVTGHITCHDLGRGYMLVKQILLHSLTISPTSLPEFRYLEPHRLKKAAFPMLNIASGSAFEGEVLTLVIHGCLIFNKCNIFSRMVLVKCATTIDIERRSHHFWYSIILVKPRRDALP